MSRELRRTTRLSLPSSFLSVISSFLSVPSVLLSVFSALLTAWNGGGTGTVLKHMVTRPGTRAAGGCGA